MFKTARTIMQDALKSSFLKGLLVTAQEKEKKPTENVALKEQIKADWEQKLKGLTNENLADLLTDIEIVAEQKQADRNSVYEKNLKFVKSSRKEAEKKMMEVAMSNPLIKEPQRKILSEIKKKSGEVTRKQLTENKIAQGMDDWTDEEFIGYMKRKYGVEYKIVEQEQKAASVASLEKNEKKIPLGKKVRVPYPGTVTDPQPMDPQEKSTGYGGDRGGVFITPPSEATSLSSKLPLGMKKISAQGNGWSLDNVGLISFGAGGSYTRWQGEPPFMYLLGGDLTIGDKTDYFQASYYFGNVLGDRDMISWTGSYWSGGSIPEELKPEIEKAMLESGRKIREQRNIEKDKAKVASIDIESAGNPASKTRPVDNPYEVWQTPNGQWTWKVLKKYQSPEKEAENEYARWFCMVYSPFVPDGEMGDVYVKDIKGVAQKVDGGPEGTPPTVNPINNSIKSKSGRSSTVVPKENIKDIYDSLHLVSTSNMSARDFGMAKPSFESIDKDIEKFDDGAYVVRWGGHWYELEPEIRTNAMWKDKLQNVYTNFEEFEAYDQIYALSKRLGYQTSKDAWDANPLVEGSVKPEEYRKVSKVVHENGKWSVKSESGKNMGTYDTKEEAVKRLRQVEYFKHHSSLRLNSSESVMTDDSPSEQTSFQEYKKKQQEEKERREQKRMKQQEKEVAYEGTLLKDIKDIKKGTKVLIVDETKDEYIFQVKGIKETYGWAVKADVEVEEPPIGEKIDEPEAKTEPTEEVHRIEMRGKKWIIDSENEVIFNTADPNEVVPFDTLTEEELARVNKELTKGAIAETPMPTRERGDKLKEKPLVNDRKLKEIIFQHHREDLSPREFEDIHETAEAEYKRSLQDAWEQIQERMGSLLGIRVKAKPRAVLFPTDEELQGLKDSIYSKFPEEGDKIFNDIKREYEEALQEETDNILSQLSAKLLGTMRLIGMGRYVVDYEVYQVSKEQPDWYEYRVHLMDDDGKILSEWDSLTETFDGINRLTKEEAEASAKEIKDDIEKGESPAKWFPMVGSMRKRSAKPMPHVTTLPDNTELEYDPTKDDWGLRDKTDPNKRYRLKQAAKSPQEMAEDKITEIIQGLARRVGPLWQAKEFNVEKGEYVGQEMDAFVTKNLTELVTEIYEKTVRDVRNNPEEYGLDVPKAKTGTSKLPLSKRSTEECPQCPSQEKWPTQERAVPIGFGKAQFYSTPAGQIDHCSYCTERKKAGAEYAGKKDDKGDMFCDYCQHCDIRKEPLENKESK